MVAVSGWLFAVAVVSAAVSAAEVPVNSSQAAPSPQPMAPNLTLVSKNPIAEHKVHGRKEADRLVLKQGPEPHADPPFEADRPDPTINPNATNTSSPKPSTTTAQVVSAAFLEMPNQMVFYALALMISMVAALNA